MSAKEELSANLREIFAEETALFEAYAQALRAAETRLARETMLTCQAASARARGRLMAELEHQKISYAEEPPEIGSAIDDLIDVSSRQIERLEKVIAAADDEGDERLRRLAAELAEEHRNRRKRLQSLTHGRD